MHVLSDFVNMRFNLRNNKTYLAEKARQNKRLIEHQAQSTRASSVTTTAKNDEKAARPKSLLKLELITHSESQISKQEPEEACFKLRFL